MDRALRQRRHGGWALDGQGGEHGADPQVASRGAPPRRGRGRAHMAGGGGRWRVGEGSKLGVLWGTGSIHGACKVSQDGGHSPNGRLAKGDPTHAPFSRVPGLSNFIRKLKLHLLI